MGGFAIDPKLAEALKGKSPEELQAMEEAVLKARMSGRGAVAAGTHEWEDGKLVATSDKYSEIVFDTTGTYVSGGELINRVDPDGETDPEKEEDDERYIIDSWDNGDGTRTVLWSDGTTTIIAGEIDDGSSELRILNQMKDSFQLALRNMGFSKDMIDELFNWASTQFQNDPSFTAERALMEMYDQPVFIARFPAIDTMRKAGMKNIPTPGQYIAYERFVSQEFQRFSYNVGGEAFDNLITRLITNQVGEIEVTERLSEAERVMYDVPQEVRDTFNDWWGSEGARNITMQLFLDPSENWSNLKDQIETAEVGGWGKMVAGLDAGWNRQMANAVADLGLSQAQTWNSFASLKDKELLFAENLTENRNLDYATQGVSAEFGIDITNPITGELTGDDALTLQDLIERRKQRRVSRFAGGGTGQAGAILSGSTTGIGATNA